MMHPRTLQLILDSLRYWVEEMHVDGFRFDAASSLARTPNGVDQLGTFLDIIQQDPVLSAVKLIAEPWDLGPDGYQVGRFPVLWAEWNGKYRDTVRRFWKGDGAQAADLAYRLTGSSDLYDHSGRRPHSSINFVTAHDGFTLRDLVSYDAKHNDANGENNRDGNNDNESWNCGVEGPTGDPAILALRARQQRNLLATLFLSQGVPMLVAGDEMGRTQQGSNNASHEVVTPTGRKITFVTNRLIRFGEAYFDTRSESYNLTVGELSLNDMDKSKSTGFLYPECKLQVDKQGQLQYDLVGNPFTLINVLDWKGTPGLN